jgi:hypothetical protein
MLDNLISWRSCHHDQFRNVCRCGTYPRIRIAIAAGAAAMRRGG